MVDDSQGFEEIVNDAQFKVAFPDDIVTRKASNALPDGFDSNNPAAPYLKMDGLGCRTDIPDALLQDDDVIDLLIEIFRSARPLVPYFD